MRNINYADHLEKMLGDAFISKGISFTHESEKGANQKLDFHLTDLGIFIEVKQYHAERIGKQCGYEENVIVLQGFKSVLFFISEVIGSV